MLANNVQGLNGFSVVSFRLLLIGFSLFTVITGHDCFAKVADKSTHSKVLRVVYGSPSTDADIFQRVYQLRLLKAALDASGQPYELIPAGRDLVQSRLLKEIAAKRIDIYWSMTSIERERLLRPIRVPLDKGLNGWRIMLVEKSNPHVFAKVRAVDDLSRYILLQGHDWPDTQILKFNGLVVDTSQHPAQLFDMLRKGRGQGFPRSVVEIKSEANAHQADFIIDPHLALYYPSAVYFFVNKENESLAEALEQGLKHLQNSGQFDQMFWQEYGETLLQLNLVKRRILVLRNPDLPLATPINNKSLWYQPVQPN